MIAAPGSQCSSPINNAAQWKERCCCCCRRYDHSRIKNSPFLRPIGGGDAMETNFTRKETIKRDSIESKPGEEGGHLLPSLDFPDWSGETRSR